MNKIKLHTCLIGKTGYNNHARDFLSELDDRIGIKVRNYTVSDKWTGLSDEPHNSEQYLNNKFKKMLVEQSLWVSKDKIQEFEIYSQYPNEGETPLDIVFMETNHHYFYEKFNGKSIAYNVWETTRYPDEFFKALLNFDQLWVASEWQKEMVIEQGYPAEKVKVVPEAVNSKKYFPLKENVKNEKKKFLIFGRWEYRKSTKEMIEAWVDVFKDIDDVELIISVDNPYSVDKMNSTEERLEFYKIPTEKIKILHFPSNEEYVNLLQTGDVFLSCSRAEGWNLPLIEAMACGIPSFYSDWSGQLEFAKGRGIAVNISKLLPAMVGEGKMYTQSPIAGDYCEPDWEDFKKKLLDVYNNLDSYKEMAISESEEIRNQFTWERAAEIAEKNIRELMPNVFPKKTKVGNKLLYDDFAYVTCGNSQYLPLIEKLVKSLKEFSERKIIVYSIDCDIEYDYPNLIKRRLKTENYSEHDKWYWKQFSNIQSILEEEFDNFVWIDGDVIANYNIDDFSNYFSQITNCPISDIHNQEEHYGPMILDDGSQRIQFFNEHFCQFLNFPTIERSLPISHVCSYVYNKNCLKFFQEVIELYKSVPLEKYKSIALWNDEGCHNMIQSKYKSEKHLPLSNLDVSNYDNHTKLVHKNSLDNFVAYWRENGEYNFGKIYAYEYIPENKRQILYFHGNKNLVNCDTMIDVIKLFRDKKFRDSEHFYTSHTEIKNLGNIKGVLGGTYEIGSQYGWDYGIYHEIYNLLDYCKHGDTKIEKGDVVVDLGGNIGIFNRWAGSQGASKIISFEPDQRYFELLKLNCHENSIIFNAAVSNKVGKITLNESEHLGGSFIGERTQGNFKTYEVNTYSLDFLFESKLVDKIDYLKVDIEGAELLAMEGLSDENLQKINKIVFEYHHAEFDFDENKRLQLIERIRRNGFNSFLLYMGVDDKLQMIYFWK